ncbi:MAG TPA: hypothetical protein VGL89_07675 [Candidatus Koribacter sp.]
MDITKIKIRVGEHEFEAEGPVETVQAQLEAFKELIGSVPHKNVSKPLAENAQSEQNQESDSASTHVPIEKILHVSGRVVSLTALPTSAEDAALLIMLGHKDMRNNVAVTGQEIGDGLAQSGKPVLRVDRIMDKPIESAHVLKSGIKRSTRYRLTNAGLQKALSVAKDLIATLP